MGVGACLSADSPHLCRPLWKPEEGTRSPGTGVREGCEQHGVPGTEPESAARGASAPDMRGGSPAPLLHSQ